MASEREANKARDEHSDYLRKLGAHAVLVDEVERGEGKGYAVIAFCQQKPSKPVPDALEIEAGGKKKKVPLEVRVAPMATLE